MRQQYHSRQIDGELLIWDVRRLISLTMDMPIRDVLLSNIRELDEIFWFKCAAPTCRAIAHHADLINSADLAYPIILSADGRVMDGIHRVCKALLREQETIRAVQFARDPDPDFVNVELESLPYD